MPSYFKKFENDNVVRMQDGSVIHTSMEDAEEELRLVHKAMGQIQELLEQEIFLPVIQDSDNYYGDKFEDAYSELYAAVEDFAKICSDKYWGMVNTNRSNNESYFSKRRNKRESY
jgi:hypothetical protein